MRTKFHISVPGFYTVQRYGRVRNLGENHLAEKNVYKIKMIGGVLTVYKNGIDKGAKAK